MASTSSNVRGKRSRVDEQNRTQACGSEPHRVQFIDAAQSLRFNELSRRPNAPQKFVDHDALRTLHVRNQVRTMFRNIKWEGLLDLADESYEVLTFEFLSSLTENKQNNTISFRLLNQSHTVHVDQLCDIIGSPSDQFATIPVRGALSGYNSNKAGFWTQITGRGDYDSSNARATQIIHPVMKVCYRIIASILFPQEDSNKTAQKELELLWCMVNCPQKPPHFGQWLIYKLVKLSKSPNSQVHCGGMVTIIAKHLNLRIPPGLVAMRGERWLTVSVLTQMQLLRKEDRVTHWLVEGRSYLTIDSQNKNILRLQSPTSRTNWRLVSNTGAQAPGAESQAQDFPSSSSYSEFASQHHTAYMSEFNRLQGTFDNIYGELDTLDNNYRDLSYTLENHITTQTAHNSRVDQFMHRQMAQQDAMYSILRGLQGTHLGASSSPPPQPDPSASQFFPGPYPYPFTGEWGNWSQQPDPQNWGQESDNQHQAPSSPWRPWPQFPPNP